MAKVNKQFKVDVIVNAKTKELDKLIKKMNQVQTQANRHASAQKKVTKSVDETNKAYQKSISLVNGLTKAVRHLAGGYILLQAAKAGITASDTITSAENKLNYLNANSLGSAGYTTSTSGAEVYSQDTLNATQLSMDKMYTSAQKVRIAYSDMMSNVSKSMTLASNAFGGNIDNAIRFQEIMGEAYALSGASAQEMHSSMYQLIQGLSSGVLQGDELRSVREGASMAYQAIEKYAQGIYGAETNLKDLASQGKITSDIVVAAILDNGAKMDAAFAKTEMTFAQAWTTIKNTALKSFEPVLQKLNDLLNSDVGKAIVSHIGTALVFVANIAYGLFSIIEKIFIYIHANWGVISDFLWTIGTIIAAFLIPKFILWMISAVRAGVATLIAVWADIVAFMILSKEMGFATVMADLFGITMSAWLWWLIAIIVAVVIVVIWMSDSFADACGIMVGVVFWLGATIWNIFVGLWNGLVQLLWTMFVEPWIVIIEWVLNVFNGGFNSFGDAVKNLLGQIISWFLSLGKVVTKIIDAIFGTNWTSGLNSLQDSVLAWGGNEQKITIDRNAPDGLMVDRMVAKDAYASGYDLGFSWGEKLTNSLPNVGLETTPVGSNRTLENIDENTGKIADSMALTEEDLDYLRKIANMEWKKEYTTANITVDMSNYNTINGESDLDGIVTKLADKLYEEMNVVANGVYA